MKLSNGKGFELNFSRRLVVAAKGILGIGVTFGEVAEANGEGPCLRCVGHAIAPGPTECSSDGCDSITHNLEGHP